MRIRVLGSPTGGGSPQWSCNCANCDGLRNGRIQATARTESLIAVTTNEADWLLVNASPDILTKIRDTPDLQPARAVRDSGIAAVLLMDAQIDYVTGLIMLRERGSKLPLLVTPEVLSDISTCFPITGILSHYCGVVTTELPSDGRTITIESLPGLEVQTVAIASKPPPCSPFRGSPHAGDNPGLLIQNPATGARMFCVPGLGAVTPELLTLMASCSVLLVDGTFWTEDEMITQGLSKKKAAEMGHLPQSGPGGMIEQLDKLPASIRKILIHINNTNPVLVEDCAERAELTRHGIKVAHDGTDIVF